MTDNWEHEFWQMVEEKGVGSDVRFAQACRDFIKEQLTLAEKRGEEKERKEIYKEIDEMIDVLIKDSSLHKNKDRIEDYRLRIRQLEDIKRYCKLPKICEHCKNNPIVDLFNIKNTEDL